MGTVWNLESRFLVAIQNNDVAVADALLEKGLDPDVRFHLGNQMRPAVCLCVERDNVELLSVMLQRGCSVNQTDSSGLSALHVAANHGYEKTVELLLRARAHVNAVTRQGHTPLHLASQRPSVGIVRMLVAAGAEVDRYDNEKKTPLLNACIHGHCKVADFLLKNGAKIDVCSPCGNTPLLFVASAPHVNIELLSILLNAKAKASRQNRQGESPLHAVLRGGHRPNRLEAIDVLLDHRGDVDAKTNLGHTPLHLAVLERDSQAVSKLIRAGCAVDCCDELGLTPLFYVTRDGNRQMASLLLAAGSQIGNQNWMKDLRMLASIKDPSILEWLVQKGGLCPSLAQMCRLSFRTYWGTVAQAQIDGLRIPSSIRRYLSFEIL